jgi:ribosomal protein S18 acetylase RimI-like enzyme
MRIRDYTPVDLPYLYDICVRTGDSGADARSLFTDPNLPGHYYAAPYAACNPRCVLVLEGEAPGGTRPLGYILGTNDTLAYQDWFDLHWRQAAIALYCRPASTGMASAGLGPASLALAGGNGSDLASHSEEEARIRLLFSLPFEELAVELADYPGHIHIDILPVCQGAGWGRALMDAFSLRLQALGCPGFHLGVDKRNAAGIAFYRRYGMELLMEPEWGFVFGQRL